MAKILEDGSEQLDETPVAIPVKYTRPPSQFQQLKQELLRELQAKASDHGFDTPEEADDFDCDDDPFPASRWEYSEDEEALYKEDLALVDEHRSKRSSGKSGGDEEISGGVSQEGDPPVDTGSTDEL